MQYAPKIDPTEPALIKLDRERKIPIDVASKFGVTSINGMLTFEFYKNGSLQYRKTRLETEDGGKSFKRDRSNVETCLFNEPCLEEPCGPNDVLIVTEGEIDCLSFLTVGQPFVVSVPDGAQLSKPGEGDIVPAEDKAFSWLWHEGKLHPGIAQFQRVLIATDADEKGRILRDELAVRIGRTKCYYTTFPEGCKDANEVLTKYDDGVERLAKAVEDMQPIVPARLVKFSDVPVPGERPRYRSGWIELDRHLIIMPPELIVVTGAPGSGKSQFVLALVANIAKQHGVKSAVLQFEDSIERNRMDLRLYAKAFIETAHEHGGDVDAMDKAADAWIDRYFVAIAPLEDLSPEADYTLKWLEETIEEAATRHNCKFIVIDPWNEVEHVWSGRENEAKYTNDALRKIKKLARRFQIAIIIVTHPSKEGGKQKEIAEMSLYDVAGAAAWKNKADHGIIVHRVYSDDPGQNYSFIKVDKSKNHALMGKPGTVRMQYKPQHGTYLFLDRVTS